MKSIAIVTEGLGVGGIEKSLVENLNSIKNKQDYEIDLYLLKDREDLLPQIDMKVNVIKIPELISNRERLDKLLKKSSFLKAAVVGIKMCALKTFRFESPLHKRILTSFMPKQKKVYDAVFCYSLPMSLSVFYSFYNIKAKKKAIWVHMVISDYDPKRILPLSKIYGKFDKIVNVSDYCKTATLKRFPKTKDKNIVVHNAIDAESLIKKSSEVASLKRDFIDGKKVIFTCSRLSDEKRPHLAPKILQEILKKRKDVIWLWAGAGPLYEDLKNDIEAAGLKESFILLGSIKNPYPYYLKCDVYVQLSKNESYCLSLAEAALLSPAVLTSDFPSSYEVISNKRKAEIISDVNPEFVAKKILEILDNPELNFEIDPLIYKKETDEFDLFISSF